MASLDGQAEKLGENHELRSATAGLGRSGLFFPA